MNIALYPRVSTQEQAQEGYSIGEQVDRMTKYCEAMGWNIYKVYTDAGFSGANTERPGLQRMIKDVEAGKIDKVLVYKLDRLSRSQKDTLNLIEDVFLANNTEFVSMSENFDTSTPFGRAMVGILAVFAQLEREQIKERMTMGRDARAKEGKYHGSNAVPIGYDYIKAKAKGGGELVVNEYEKLQVQKAYEMFNSGSPIASIVNTLNNAGMTHKYGEWNGTTLRRVLANKTYLGYIHHKKEWYKGTHTPLIDEETYNISFDLMKRRKEEHNTKNRRNGKVVSYLGGFLICGNCGAKYSKTTHYSRNKTKYHCYSCNSRHKKTPSLVKDPNCRNDNRKMEELDNIVFDEIKKLALDPSYFEKAKANKTEDDVIPVLLAEIDKIDGKISRLMDLYESGEPLDMVQDRIHELHGKKLKIESEIAAAKENQKEVLSKEDTFRLVNSFADILERGNFDEIRDILSALIDKIVIDGNDETIYWRFA